MRGVKGKTTQDNVIFKAKFKDLKCFVGPEAIAYQYPWLAVSPVLSLGIKHTRQPL
jgi:hypothetical protein